MKHVKCSVLDRDKERPLCRVATRGVVKFFNVIQQQKFDLQNKLNNVAPYERKIEKVYKSFDKGSFLNRLKEQSNEDEDNELNNTENKKEIEKSKPTWNVLRDEYVMNAKMENWDKEEGEDSEENEEEIISNNNDDDLDSMDGELDTKPKRMKALSKDKKKKFQNKNNKRSKRLK